jgi:hypothetical protein
MGRPDTSLRLTIAAALLGAVLSPARVTAAELKPKTVAAFDHHVQLTEARIAGELSGSTPFLWIDRLSEARRAAALVELRESRVVIEKLEARDGDEPIPVPGGMIHHWIGTVFIPGATLEQTLALVQDYDHHQDYYKPDVMRSKVLSRDGNDFRIYLRFYKKKILTSILDTEHEVHYAVVDSARAWSRSRSTHIREVEDAGTPGEKQKPEGDDRGLLWRINTYWRFEQKDGGTYVECESISLTRDIPTGLAWLIRSYVESVPRETLLFTLGATRSALLRKAAPLSLSAPNPR